MLSRVQVARLGGCLLGSLEQLHHVGVVSPAPGAIGIIEAGPEHGTHELQALLLHQFLVHVLHDGGYALVLRFLGGLHLAGHLEPAVRFPVVDIEGVFGFLCGPLGVGLEGGHRATHVLEQVGQVLGQLFQGDEDAGAQHVVGEHAGRDAGLDLGADGGGPALGLPHGRGPAHGACRVVLLGGGDDRVDAAVDLGEGLLGSPLEALGPQSGRRDPHHERVQVVSVAADDGPGEGEHVSRGGDQLAGKPSPRPLDRSSFHAPRQ